MALSAVVLAASSVVGPPARYHPSLPDFLASRLVVVPSASPLARTPELVLYEPRT